MIALRRDWVFVSVTDVERQRANATMRGTEPDFDEPGYYRYSDFDGGYRGPYSAVAYRENAA